MIIDSRKISPLIFFKKVKMNKNYNADSELRISKSLKSWQVWPRFLPHLSQIVAEEEMVLPGKTSCPNFHLPNLQQPIHGITGGYEWYPGRSSISGKNLRWTKKILFTFRRLELSQLRSFRIKNPFSIERNTRNKWDSRNEFSRIDFICQGTTLEATVLCLG